MNTKLLQNVFMLFTGWRVLILIFAIIGIAVLPAQKNFVGNGFTNYIQNPLFYGWGNFDGEHYLSIAKSGYGFGEQAFFPLYPLLLQFFKSTFWFGIVISNLCFAVVIAGFYKLLRLDFSEKIAKLSLLLFILFPTSFYFGAIYTESLFLMFVIWSFYFARKSHWFLASILAGLACSTRFVGIILLPVFLIEYWLQKKYKFSNLVFILLIPIGLFLYMFFLHKNYGDPLLFFKTLSTFGEQRSSHIILLPQVFYRYVFKILPAVNYTYWPNVFTTYLEFLTALVFVFISIFSFRKLRTSYWLFMVLGFVIPTLTGSFSSLPRYVLILFPAFIFTAQVLAEKANYFKLFILGILLVSLGLATGLFITGHWVS